MNSRRNCARSSTVARPSPTTNEPLGSSTTRARVTGKRFPREVSHLRAGVARKPARLQPRKFAIVAQRRERAVDRIAQRLVLLGKGDPQLLVGRNLERDRQLRTILHQPRDDREELDYEPDAPRLEIVQGRRYAVIGIVFDGGDRAFRQ